MSRTASDQWRRNERRLDLVAAGAVAVLFLLLAFVVFFVVVFWGVHPCDSGSCSSTEAAAWVAAIVVVAVGVVVVWRMLDRAQSRSGKLHQGAAGDGGNGVRGYCPHCRLMVDNLAEHQIYDLGPSSTETTDPDQAH